VTDQEILDNAPEGATHWDCSEYMIHVHDGDWNYWSKAAGWNETKPEEETRSLADIKRIVELEKERDSLLRLISYVKSIVFSKVKCSYVSFKRPLEELLKDQGNG